MPAKPLIVDKSIDINAPPSKVWRIIASPELWPKWMMVPPETEFGESTLQLGSKALWRNEEGEAYLTGTITTLEPERRLVFDLDDVSWTRKAEPGEVTYGLTISQARNHTHLDFRVGDLAIDPDGQEWYDAYANSREPELIKELAEK